MTYGHAICGFTDIIRVPVEWIFFDCGWHSHLNVKPEHFDDMRELLQREVSWLRPESHSWQADNIQRKNINEIFHFEMVTTSTLRMILNKFECHVIDAEKARDDFKEFTGLL